MKFAALGRTQWLYDSIVHAVEKNHELVLIGTCEAAPEYERTEEDLERLAHKVRCAYFCSGAINRSEYLRMAEESGAEVAISVNWKTLIGPDMLDCFKHGIINAHAGDLPRYRGNACPNWAILAGEEKVVLTLHRMVPELDAGPILLQRALPLTDETYIADVYRFMADSIPSMFAELLDGLSDGSITPRKQPQAPESSLRCFPRMPHDGIIDWDRPADELARLIRASGRPFAGSYSYLGLEKLTIWRAHTEALPYPHLGIPSQVVDVRKETGEVAVLTGNGVLVLEEIETETVGICKPCEVIRSTRIRLGADTEKMLVQLQERLKEMEWKHTRS